MLGNGMLFPWNVFITCTAYFSARLAGSPYASNFNHFFSFGFMVTNLLALTYLSWARGRQMTRIKWAFIVNLVIFFLCVLLTRITRGIDAITFFTLNMFMVITCGVSTAFLQNGIFGLAAMFPQHYMTAVMSGQGFAGAAVAVSQMISLVVASGDDTNATPSSVGLSAFMYFLFAFLVILACWSLTAVLERLEIYKQVVGSFIGPSDEEEPVTPISPSPLTTSSAAVSIDETDLLGKQPAATLKSITMHDRKRILKHIWPLALAVFWVYLVTLSVFPPIISEIFSLSNPKSVLFVPGAFLMFALGDWLGKAMPGFPSPRQLLTRFFPRLYTHLDMNSTVELTTDPSSSVPISARPLWILSAALIRSLFILLFLASNITLYDPLTHIPLPRQFPFWIQSDTLYYLIMLLFAVSNGYLGSLAMMHAPALMDRVGRSEVKRRMGMDSPGYEPLSLSRRNSTSGLLVGSESSVQPVNEGVTTSDDLAAREMGSHHDGDSNDVDDEFVIDEAELNQLKEACGSMMVFFLTAGLTTGSLVSFAIRSGLCGWCDPFVH